MKAGKNVHRFESLVAFAGRGGAWKRSQAFCVDEQKLREDFRFSFAGQKMSCLLSKPRTTLENIETTILLLLLFVGSKQKLGFLLKANRFFLDTPHLFIGLESSSHCVTPWNRWQRFWSLDSQTSSSET